MQRVSIVGAPGSGKSYLARSLAPVLDLPVLHLDLLFWGADIRPLPKAEQKAALFKALQQRRYILEGGFPWTYADRIADCDTLVWLDTAAPVRFLNMITRQWLLKERIGQHQPDAEGRKRLSGAYRPSAIRQQKAVEARYLEPYFAAPPPNVRMIRLKNRTDLRKFLSNPLE